ncbi:MAG: hypothetical protein N2053_02205 [Chitinispirillaceae bacterium]|nr:hypothetical protein [Chitinispirillaceae bacterium]
MNDTSLLSFSVKEEPSVYSMTFPISFSLYYLTQNYLNKLSIEVSWLRKSFSGTISRADTSIKGDFKYYESMDIFKCFIFLNGGMRIPEQYFSVSGAEKTYLDVGIGISPLVGFLVKKRAEVPKNDERLNEIKKHIDLSSIFIHGGALNLRGGITGLKKIDKRSSAIIEVFVDLCANGYFLNHGVRVKTGDIYTADVKKDKPLFWFSTLLGIRFNLLRYKYEKI